MSQQVDHMRRLGHVLSTLVFRGLPSHKSLGIPTILYFLIIKVFLWIRVTLVGMIGGDFFEENDFLDDHWGKNASIKEFPEVNTLLDKAEESINESTLLRGQASTMLEFLTAVLAVESYLFSAQELKFFDLFEKTLSGNLLLTAPAPLDSHYEEIADAKTCFTRLLQRKSTWFRSAELQPRGSSENINLEIVKELMLHGFLLVLEVDSLDIKQGGCYTHPTIL